jgi:hypothetical protein
MTCLFVLIVALTKKLFFCMLYNKATLLAINERLARGKS